MCLLVVILVVALGGLLWGLLTCDLTGYFRCNCFGIDFGGVLICGSYDCVWGIGLWVCVLEQPA